MSKPSNHSFAAVSLSESTQVKPVSVEMEAQSPSPTQHALPTPKDQSIDNATQLAPHISEGERSLYEKGFLDIPPKFGGPITRPTHNDVLNGRGGAVYSHPGNVQYRNIVNSYKAEYLSPSVRKLEKVTIAAKLVTQIRCMNPPGRFLIKEGDYWYEIGDIKARKKAGQAMRENAPTVREALKKEKKIQRNQVPSPEPSHQVMPELPQLPQAIPTFPTCSQALKEEKNIQRKQVRSPQPSHQVIPELPQLPQTIGFPNSAHSITKEPSSPRLHVPPLSITPDQVMDVVSQQQASRRRIASLLSQAHQEIERSRLHEQTSNAILDTYGVEGLLLLQNLTQI